MNTVIRWMWVLIPLFWGVPAAAGQGWERHEIKAMVAREANRMGLPISLALAVAHVESYFNPQAVSPVGATGVMQIMPATAREEYGIHRQDLKNPVINVRIGVHFLKRLIEAYDGRVDIALSHYNGGSSVVTASGSLRVIPATRSYVNNVLDLQTRYKAHLRKHGMANDRLHGTATQKSPSREMLAWAKDY